MPPRHSNPHLSKTSPSKPVPRPIWTQLKLSLRTPVTASRPATRTTSSSRTSPPRTAAQDSVSPSPPASSPSTVVAFVLKTIPPSVRASSSNFRQPMVRLLPNIRPDPGILTRCQLPTPAKKDAWTPESISIQKSGPGYFLVFVFFFFFIFPAEVFIFPFFPYH